MLFAIGWLKMDLVNTSKMLWIAYGHSLQLERFLTRKILTW